MEIHSESSLKMKLIVVLFAVLLNVQAITDKEVQRQWNEYRVRNLRYEILSIVSYFSFFFTATIPENLQVSCWGKKTFQHFQTPPRRHRSQQWAFQRRKGELQEGSKRIHRLDRRRIQGIRQPWSDQQKQHDQHYNWWNWSYSTSMDIVQGNIYNSLVKNFMVHF